MIGPYSNKEGCISPKNFTRLPVIAIKVEAEAHMKKENTAKMTGCLHSALLILKANINKPQIKKPTTMYI
jgi:hypothetical protein